MNSHHPDRPDHGRMLGEGHPHRFVQHEHDEQVFGKNCTEWAVEWIKHLLEADVQQSPLFKRDYDPFDDRLIIRVDGREEGVAMLTANLYSQPSGSYQKSYLPLPRGNYHLFVAPFMVYASGGSRGEYPSLSTEQAFELALKTIDSVYRLDVLLDGMSLECCKVLVDGSKDVQVTVPRNNNILGISPGEFGEEERRVHVVSAGWVCFLHALTPGLHYLEVHADAKVYHLHQDWYINTRGPATQE